jgi:hypothetical protein
MPIPPGPWHSITVRLNQHECSIAGREDSRTAVHPHRSHSSPAATRSRHTGCRIAYGCSAPSFLHLYLMSRGRTPKSQLTGELIKPVFTGFLRTTVDGCRAGQLMPRGRPGELRLWSKTDCYGEQHCGGESGHRSDMIPGRPGREVVDPELGGVQAGRGKYRQCVVSGHVEEPRHQNGPEKIEQATNQPVRGARIVPSQE